MITEPEPTLSELIRRALTSRLGDMNVACPGIVVDYDAAAKTATIQPAVRSTILDDDGNLVGEDIPPIPNVPVVAFETATFSISSKLVAGDTVLLVFNSRSPTEWRTTGEISTPADARMHGLGYPVAIPGYTPNTHAPADTDDSIGVPGGLRIHFTPSAVAVGTGSDFAAMAAKVAANFTALQTLLLTNTGAPLTFTPSPVASTNLKAD